jgi:hypothetical protein
MAESSKGGAAHREVMPQDNKWPPSDRAAQIAAGDLAVRRRRPAILPNRRPAKIEPALRDL